MGLTHSPRIATDGLVLCLDAGNVRSYPKSGTVWSDLSGNGFSGNLTDYNMDATNWQNGYFLFDGSDEKFIITGSSSYSSFSISVWFNFVSTSLSFHRIYSRNSGGTMAIEQYVGYKQMRFSYNPLDTNLGSTVTIRSGPTINNGEWHHIFVTNDSSDLSTGAKLYIDGRYYASNGASTTLVNGHILGMGWNSVFPSNVKISQFKIYNRPLVSQEIKQNYLATKGRFNL